MKLVIGNKNLSSWSLRPWLLLKQAGIPFEEHLFLFESEGWREKIVALSPTRKVPALRDGELVVWDSLAICEYVAEKHPEANLWPSDPAMRAVARSVCAEMHSGFPNVRKNLSMDVTARYEAQPRSAETSTEIERIQTIWRESLERSGGPFLFGRFSVADAMYAPVVYRFRTYGVPCELAWFKMMLELPAMKEWERAANEEVAAQKPSMPDPGSAQHCYAVIFTSKLRQPAEGYAETAKRIEELAQKQPGFLGIESARDASGFGISVSYFESPEAITQWKAQVEHLQAQKRGREEFYDRYEVRVCNVERGYKFQRE